VVPRDLDGVVRLQADFGLRRGALELDVELELDGGRTFALVGPNGAGKTSLLRAVAGLTPIDRGSLRLDGRVLDGGPGGEFVDARERDVGLVFQEPRLFPHLTALDNAAFGPRSRGRTRSEARRIAGEWLERVGAAPLARRKPSELSGGEAQRVALARALASEPQVLLLDEPLASVDASAKLELRAVLRETLADFDGVRLVVAHDIADALALAERLVVLEGGRVAQIGSVTELVRRPASSYVADLVGLNCYRGHCREGQVELEGGSLVVAHASDGPVVVTVHPRAVAVYRERPQGSPRNVWSAPVQGLEPSLDRVRVQMGGGLPIVAELTHAAVEELRLGDGGEVWIAIKATEIGVAPA